MSKLTEASAAERHREIAAQFTRLIEGTSDWSAPTPVPEWCAGDVVDHLTSWFAGLMSTCGVELPRAIGDRRADFAAQTEAVQALLDDPDTAHQPITIGPTQPQPLAAVIDNFYTIDVFLHGWDLARATGQEIELDTDSTVSMHAGFSALGPALQASGQYGPPFPVPADDTPQRRLLGLIGRDPDWQPSS